MSNIPNAALAALAAGDANAYVQALLVNFPTDADVVKAILDHLDTKGNAIFGTGSVIPREGFARDVAALIRLEKASDEAMVQRSTPGD